MKVGMGGRLHAGGIECHGGSLDTDLHCGCLSVGGPNSNSSVVVENGVDNMYGCRRILIQRYVQAILREAKDIHVFKTKALARKKTDAIEARTNSVDPHIANGHHIVRSGGNHNSIGAGNQHRAHLTSSAINGDGLGDGETAESAWIKSVDLATGYGLRDGSRKRLAWRGPTTGVSVVTYAGNPSTGSLTVH